MYIYEKKKQHQQNDEPQTTPPDHRPDICIFVVLLFNSTKKNVLITHLSRFSQFKNKSCCSILYFVSQNFCIRQINSLPEIIKRNCFYDFDYFL